MSYVCTHVQDDSSYTPYVNAMFTTLSGAGWELYDEVSATDKVYRSKGENNSYCYGYMEASLESTYYLQLRVFQDWDNSSHVGIAGACNTTSSRVIIYYYKPVLMYCNKDYLAIWSSQDSMTDACISVAGIMSEVFDTTLTIITSDVSSGSSVTIPVVSSSGFLKGARYKIIGINHEGREIVTISSVLDSTNLIVESLVTSYSGGSYIGKEPCPLVNLCTISNSTLYFATGYNSYSVNGTDNQTSFYSKYESSYMLSTSMLDPDPSYNLYGLAPRQFYEYSGYSCVGWFNNMFNSPVSPSTCTAYDDIYMNGDLYTRGAQPVLTVTSGTSNTITLANVSWSTDELQNKIVIISVGNSAGHTRKIISNTSDTLTVGVDFDIAVNSDDIIMVCDEVYRPLSTGFCFKEII